MEPFEVKSEKQESFFKETLRFAIITLIIVLPIRLFVAEPFIVSGASMKPTFESGDYLIVDRISYNLNEPKRGDVIIFRYPKDPNKYFIKRIVGLPGDIVELSEKAITIKNKENPSGFELDQSYISRHQSQNFSQPSLGSDQYFVIGDNRPQSSDSRIWGTVPRINIIGRAWLRLFPVNEIDFLPGNYAGLWDSSR